MTPNLENYITTRSGVVWSFHNRSSLYVFKTQSKNSFNRLITQTHYDLSRLFYIFWISSTITFFLSCCSIFIFCYSINSIKSLLKDKTYKSKLYYFQNSYAPDLSILIISEVSYQLPHQPING